MPKDEYLDGGHILKRSKEDGSYKLYDLNDVGCPACGGTGFDRDSEDLCSLCEGYKLEM